MILLPRKRDIVLPQSGLLPSRQRGFLLNPYRFGGGATDPFFANVVSMSNLGASFTDAKGKVWTPFGNAQLSGAQTRFGNNTVALDGVGDYYNTPNSTDFDFGSGRFTLEAWVFPTADVTLEQAVLVKWDTGSLSTNASWWFGRGTGASGRKIAFYYNTATGTQGFHSSNTTIPLNQWSFISASGGRTGDAKNYFHLNGIADGSHAIAGGLNTINKAVALGAQNSGTNPFTGFIGPFRITKGVSRYGASNYSPPTGLFPTS